MLATNFKIGDFVYICETNTIGEVLAVFDFPVRGVQEVRTDMDGMRDGENLEPLNANHFTKPDVKVSPSLANLP